VDLDSVGRRYETHLLLDGWESRRNTAREFIQDLASRLANRIQLTTDGLRPYADAAEIAFAGNVDYAMLIKLYGSDQTPEETRYSPAVCIGVRQQPISSDPDPKHISTSTLSGRTSR
jgi:hypothetical protein